MSEIETNFFLFFFKKKKLDDILNEVISLIDASAKKDRQVAVFARVLNEFSQLRRKKTKPWKRLIFSFLKGC